MKEFNSRSQRSEHRAAEHIRPTTKPQRRSTEFQPPSLDRPGEGHEPWSQPTGTGRSLIRETSGQRKEKYRPALPPGILANPIPRCDGRLTFETVRRDAEAAREKFNDATGDYLATVVPDRFFAFAAKSWHTESNPATQTIGALEGLCGWLQDVDAPLKNVGIALGLPSGGAAFAAG
jgi:hypothetical protein